jgi:hypothetical protein
LGCDKGKKVTNPRNQPPVISSITADPDSFIMGNSTTITVNASDPDSDALNYRWEAHGQELLPIPSGSNTLMLTNCCPIFEITSAVVLSVIDDGNGGEARDSIRVWILPLPGKQ